MTGVFYKKGNFGHRSADTGRTPWEVKGRDQGGAAIAKECQTFPKDLRG